MVSILNITSGVFFHSSGVSFGTVIAVKREGSAKQHKLNPFVLHIVTGGCREYRQCVGIVVDGSDTELYTYR